MCHDASDNQDVSIMFCSNILEIGKCPQKNVCPYRHVFSKDLDTVTLPSKGEVVFQILYVQHSTSFWVRLLEQEEISSGSMKRVENQSMTINLKLLKFYQHEQNR